MSHVAVKLISQLMPDIFSSFICNAQINWLLKFCSCTILQENFSPKDYQEICDIERVPFVVIF